MSSRAVLSRRRPRQGQRQGLEALIGADVEVRAGAAVFRGQLEAVDADFLRLVDHHGREILVARCAVVAVLDERRGLLPEQHKANL
jgi:2,3-bisphosphoglycerate-independent phosphoglycerate mutase